eukprot:4366747-Amphidinium_carterae.1
MPLRSFSLSRKEASVSTATMVSYIMSFLLGAYVHCQEKYSTSWVPRHLLSSGIALRKDTRQMVKFVAEGSLGNNFSAST